MMKQLIILAVVVCAVLADNYFCGAPGDPFECFESAAGAKFCVSNGKESKVICGKCRKKYEFCANQAKESKRPEIDCGAGWDATACTPDISDVPPVF